MTNQSNIYCILYLAGNLKQAKTAHLLKISRSTSNMPFYHADDNDGYSHDDHDSYHDDHNNSNHDDDNSLDDDGLHLLTPVYGRRWLSTRLTDDDDDDSDDDDHVDGDDNHLPTPVYRRRWLPTSSTFKSNPRSASDGDAPVQRVQVVDLWWHWK